MPSEDNREELPTLFFPYYVNQPRLLDVYAILNSGFSEYEEMQTSEEKGTNTKKNGKLNTSAGFKVFKLGVDGELSKELSASMGGGIKTRKVQTTTSMLGLVLEQLRKYGYIKRVEDASTGDFVTVPVTLQINSIKALIREAIDLLELSKRMQSLGGTAAKKDQNINELKKIDAVCRELFDAEEFLSDADKYAIIGNISNEHFYQAHRRDVIGTELTCFGQIRRVYPHGTQLMKNTVFSKVKSADAKKSLIDSLGPLADNGVFEYDSVIVAEIKDKPVYELEVIALYQEARQVDGRLA